MILLAAKKNVPPEVPPAPALNATAPVGGCKWTLEDDEDDDDEEDDDDDEEDEEEDEDDVRLSGSGNVPVGAAAACDDEAEDDDDGADFRFFFPDGSSAASGAARLSPAALGIDDDTASRRFCSIFMVDSSMGGAHGQGITSKFVRVGEINPPSILYPTTEERMSTTMPMAGEFHRFLAGCGRGSTAGTKTPLTLQKK
jgi:hypothetical protein